MLKVNKPVIAPSLFLKTKKMFSKHGLYYLMLLPALAGFIMFNYLPMYGILIAFKNYRFLEGIWASPWVGMKHFDAFFNGSYFWRVMKNTWVISLLKLIFGFPAPIILALLFNELFNKKFKAFAQTVSYLPYFMSWVILAGIFTELLSPNRGAINYILTSMDLKPIYFLASEQYFVGILVVTYVWQQVGWGTIIFLAAIAGVNQESYEAATIDGANRLQKIINITLPAIAPAITIMFILSLGGIMSAGFDQVLNLYNPAVYSVGDIIDTYVYRIGIQKSDYSFATAVGLFQNVIGLILVLSANAIIKRFNNHGIW